MNSSNPSSIGATFINPSPSFDVNSTSLPAAYHNNTLGFGFSGSGFLVFYFTGVIALLQSLGLINNSTVLAGSSGGALVSLATCSRIDPARQFRANLDLAASCRPTYGCRGDLGAKVADVLNDTLPANAADLCRQRAFITLTRARPYNQTDAPLLVTNIRNKSQLISAAVGTSWLPFWSGPTATTDFAGLQVYDGGFSTALPCPPAQPYPGGVTYCVKVSANAPNETAGPQPIPAGHRPQALDFLTAGAAASGPSGPFLPLDPKVLPTPKPDIYPGLSGPLRFPPEVWNSYGLLIPDNTTLLYLHNQGRKDAAFWAKKSGLVTQQQVDRVMAATEIQLS
eukprot:GHUV01001547.1.p1 GENE.GHUV01001547.1~~GHUV01001547.1.p1  ORF type:complete len:339 (+),score=33.22 GHUV01001547.1:221-1237(+)